MPPPLTGIDKQAQVVTIQRKNRVQTVYFPIPPIEANLATGPLSKSVTGIRRPFCVEDIDTLFRREHTDSRPNLTRVILEPIENHAPVTVPTLHGNKSNSTALPLQTTNPGSHPY